MAASSESKRLQFLSKVGLGLVALALVLTLLGGWLATTRPIAAIDQSKLDNYRQGLKSAAAESLLLADQYKDRKPLANYMKVSAEKLYLSVSDTSEKLQTEPPEAGLDEQVAQTAEKATELADTLTRLAELPDQEELNSIMAKLQDIHQQLEAS